MMPNESQDEVTRQRLIRAYRAAADERFDDDGDLEFVA